MNNNIKIILTLFSLNLLLVSCTGIFNSEPEEALQCKKGEPFLEENIQQWLEYYNIPGLCVAVIEYDSIDWIKGYGVLDKDTGGQINPQRLMMAETITLNIPAIIIDISAT